MCTLVRFLSSVNEGVGLHIVVSAKRLVALWTIVFDPTVHLLVTEKVAPRRKCLLTQVASYLVLHHQLSPPPLMGDPFLLLKTAIHHFPFPTILKCLTIGLDWIGFTSGYRVSTALRIVYWPTPFLTRLTASRSGWLFQLTIPPKVTIAEKA